ncbi:MAG: hypothetical protein WC247_10325 [Porticoccaceae bacterium]
MGHDAHARAVKVFTLLPDLVEFVLLADELVELGFLAVEGIGEALLVAAQGFGFMPQFVGADTGIA